MARGPTSRRSRTRKDPFCFIRVPCHNSIERFFNKIKQCRLSNYLAFVKLASIRSWLCARVALSKTSGLEVRKTHSFQRANGLHLRAERDYFVCSRQTDSLFDSEEFPVPI